MSLKDSRQLDNRRWEIKSGQLTFVCAGISVWKIYVMWRIIDCMQVCVCEEGKSKLVWHFKMFYLICYVLLILIVNQIDNLSWHSTHDNPKCLKKKQVIQYLALFCNFKNITMVLFLVNCMVYNKMSFWFIFYYTLCNTCSLSYFPYSVFAF